MRAAKAVGRAVVRAYGMSTAAFRTGPDFLLIGAKRSGTTSLYRYLAEHPDVLPLFPSARFLPMKDDLKGVHYFDTAFRRGSVWYRSHFPTASVRWRHRARTGRSAVCGDGSPYYLTHPSAARRAAQLCPDVKLVVMLRDPVHRTYSHWKEQTRNGVETLSFADALAAEPARVADAEERLAADDAFYSFAHEHQSYARHSEYVDGVRRWLEVYPREQLHVVWSERFYADPQAGYDAVCAHLGLSRHQLSRPAVWNSADVGGGLPAGLAAELRDRFAPSVDRLADLLGEPVPWPVSTP